MPYREKVRRLSVRHGMGDGTGLRSWRSLVKQCLIFLVDYISVISYLGTTVRAGSHTVVTHSAPLCFAYKKLEQEKLFRAREMSRKRVHPSSFRKIRELEGHFLFNVHLLLPLTFTSSSSFLFSSFSLLFPIHLHHHQHHLSLVHLLLFFLLHQGLMDPKLSCISHVAKDDLKLSGSPTPSSIGMCHLCSLCDAGDQA